MNAHLRCRSKRKYENAGKRGRKEEKKRREEEERKTYLEQIQQVVVLHKLLDDSGPGLYVGDI